MTAMPPDCTTLGQVVRKLDGLFRAAGLEQPRLDARLIAAHAIECRPETVLINPERMLTGDDLDAINGLAFRRLEREPVSHLLGWREFWSIPFLVNEDTLTPRPETETLVDCVLSALADGRCREPVRVLDLGTGTGCILIALLSELPRATGLGVDISRAALEVARENAKRANVSDRLELCRGDWLSETDQSFDVVVSNPPYIPRGEIALLEPEVSKYEPVIALDGGPDGLDAYRLLAASVGPVLNPGGFAAFEIGMGQARDVADMFRNAGFHDVGCQRDPGGVERVVTITKTG